MGNQTTTDGSEDSSNDHVYMMRWMYVPGGDNLVLDFWVDLVVKIVQLVVFLCIKHQLIHMVPCTMQVLCDSTMSYCFWKGHLHAVVRIQF